MYFCMEHVLHNSLTNVHGKEKVFSSGHSFLSLSADAFYDAGESLRILIPPWEVTAGHKIDS